ncbi:MAG: T9SS type A sorting domain-containing protein, partial [Bacteroidia bacterium]
MKKRNIIISLAIVAVATISSFTIIKYQNGTATAYTNSPHDGAGDCTGCHSGGSATPVINFTATPAFGSGNTYVPGTVYTLSYNVTGYPKFGFDIELNAGNLTTSMGAGTNVALTNSQVTANPYSGGYPANVSHTVPIASTSSATWHWTAPASGTVYIYSVGLGVNGNGSTSGDKMAQHNLVLTPASTAGITEYIGDQFEMNVYPNPAVDNVNLTYTLSKRGSVSVKIFDINGKLSKELVNETQDEGEQKLTASVTNLSKGIYS